MTSKREQLIQTAVTLFAKNGFHNTGIDLIAEQAGVTKRTMYRHFRSKEELILAALRDYDARFRNRFMQSVESKWDDPKDRLLGIFEVAYDWFTGNDFYGCMFINAIGEYSESHSAIREVCKEFKRLMLGYYSKLAKEAGAQNPEHLAEQLSLLFEGAIVTHQVSQKPEAGRTACDAAKVLIEAAFRNGQTG
ncbi:MAG TPA: TetR family transcriptional regulator [Porticoccaceae bacterium]|nr:TetR family transcriptional regulator [Porticoccaceae bacterium]